MKVTTWVNMIEEDGLEYPEYLEVNKENPKNYDSFYESIVNRVVLMNLQTNNLTRAMREDLHNLEGSLVTDVIFNRKNNEFTLYSLVTRKFQKFTR
jgi:uncharacterized protein YkuJ